MENVLSAFIIIFVLVFGTLTLSEATMTSQESIQNSFREMESRLGEQSRTSLTAVDDPMFVSDSEAALTYENSGSTRLTDFDQWDVFVQYFDASTPSDYHIDRMKYSEDSPSDNEWTVEGIYLDASDDVDEVFEPGILNPGEQIILTLNFAPQVGPGEAAQTVVVAPNGVGTTHMFIRNIPPELITNLGLTITHGETGLIDNTLLQSMDEDGTPDNIIYSILDGPGGGTLSLPDSFTQTDIDSGLLTYTHNLGGAFGFEFTISDGIDTVGPYTFDLTVLNAEPILAVNTGVTAGSGQTTITSDILSSTDADDSPADLTYTVTTMPANGSLNPGAVFTQEHIDSGLLTYTRSASGSDSFEVSVTDGQNILGPFTVQVNEP